MAGASQQADEGAAHNARLAQEVEDAQKELAALAKSQAAFDVLLFAQVRVAQQL